MDFLKIGTRTQSSISTFVTPQMEPQMDFFVSNPVIFKFNWKYIESADIEITNLFLTGILIKKPAAFSY